tara:strand:+ start:1348 stop:1896 length:549 start_codon:yes stop_codon:yes gene_type:complete
MIHDYAFVDDVLSWKECKYLRNYGHRKVKESLIEGAQVHVSRKSKNCFISSNVKDKKVKEIMTKVVRCYFDISRGFFKFPIEIIEPIQYAEYDEGMYYQLHADSGFTIDRDISASVVLSARDKYEGGELKFGHLKSPTEEKLGRIIVFPSAIQHEVLPVKKGRRSSLVLWGRRGIADDKKAD